MISFMLMREKKRLTTTSSCSDPDDFDSVVPEQIDLPPGRRLPLCLRTPLAIMLRRLLTVVAVGGGATTYCRRLVRWLSECHVCAQNMGNCELSNKGKYCNLDTKLGHVPAAWGSHLTKVLVANRQSIQKQWTMTVIVNCFRKHCKVILVSLFIYLKQYSHITSIIHRQLNLKKYYSTNACDNNNMTAQLS